MLRNDAIAIDIHVGEKEVHVLIVEALHSKIPHTGQELFNGDLFFIRFK